MSDSHRRTKTIHKQQHRNDSSTSSSSSYYELDINYSPHKEKLYLQLQSVNKGTLTEESNSSSNNNNNHVTVHQKSSASNTEPKQQSTNKIVTEHIKDKFLEEIMPLYMNHVASNKKRKKKMKEKNKIQKTSSVCFCGFDFNSSAIYSQPIVMIANKTNKPKNDKECNKPSVMMKVAKSKSLTTDSYPASPDTTDSVVKKSKASKSGVPKEKGKLTTKKAPQAIEASSESSSRNHAGDATLQISSLDDTTTDGVPTPLNQKTVRKNKPKTTTISTQVKPRHLRAINLKIKQSDPAPKNVIPSQINNNKELYFILVSQNGFEHNKQIKIPVDLNQLQSPNTISTVIEEKPKKRIRFDCNNNNNNSKKHSGADKEIQTKKAIDACVSIQTSAKAMVEKSISKVDGKNVEIDTEVRDILSCRETKPKKRCRGYVFCETESSTPSEQIPVKENPMLLHNRIPAVINEGVTMKSVINHKLPPPPSRNFTRDSLSSSGPNPFFPHTFRDFQIRSRATSSRNSANTMNPFMFQSTPRIVTTSTNTDNQFFLGSSRQIGSYPDKKADAVVQVKNIGSTAADETVLRAEISFSDLNLKPVLSYYMNQMGGVTNCQPHDLVRFDASARAKRASKFRHRVQHSRMQNMVETTKKQCDEVRETGGLFEVEGIEPPKKIGFDVAEKPQAKGNHLCSSHFAVIEIKPDEQATVSKSVDVIMLDPEPVDSLEVLPPPPPQPVQPEENNNVEQIVEETIPLVVPVEKDKPRKHRPFVRATRKTRLFQLSRGIGLKKQRVAEQKITPTTTTTTQPAPVVNYCRETKPAVNNNNNNLDRIMEESLSHLSTVAMEPSNNRKEIVKKMKEADDYLAQTIDRVLRMVVTNQSKKEVSVQSNISKEVLKKDECDRKESTKLTADEIVVMKDDVASNNKQDTTKSTKVSLLSEWDEIGSTAYTNNTSLQSKPSYSSGDSTSRIKRKKKKKFKPMLPIKIKNPKVYTTSVEQKPLKQKLPEECSKPENNVARRKSSAFKSFWSTNKSQQKCSDCTVATRMGPSLKSTQLFVSCAHKSSTSAKKPLGSTFLFTKDYRNSKTKLSAFQKRKLYGEYLRKTEGQNHSVHSICEIIVSEEEKDKNKMRYARKELPKECNQEMKVVVKESPMHRFVFHNYNNTPPIRNCGATTSRPQKPVRRIAKPIINTTKPPSTSIKRITTSPLNRSRVTKARNQYSRKNGFILMEMFNNKHFGAESSSSLSYKESVLENFFRNQRDESPHSVRSHHTSPMAAAEESLEEQPAIRRDETKTEIDDVLSKHERFLVETADQLRTKPPAKSYENSLSLHNKGKEKLNLGDRKLTKSDGYCSSGGCNEKVNSVERIWFRMPNNYHEKPSIVVTDKFSTDSLERPYSSHPPIEQKLQTIETIFKPSNIVPRSNVITVAYNTEVKYDKDNSNMKSDTKTEVHSSATFGESGYESNKSKNTLKRFFRRKFNIFKPSKLEIAMRSQQQSSVVAGCSSKLDAESSTVNSYLGGESSKSNKASLSKRSSAKKSKDVCHSSTTNVRKENATTTPRATERLAQIKINKKNEIVATKKMVTWSDFCSRHPLTHGLLQFCYTNRPITASPQILPALQYRNNDNVAESQSGPCNNLAKKFFCKKNSRDEKKIYEVSPIPEKLTVTVATETFRNNNNQNINRGGEVTDFDLKAINSQKEMIVYLESRFRELEMRIDKVVNATKILQDSACMCGEDEFRVREITPKTNISHTGQNTDKCKKIKTGLRKLETCVGTDYEKPTYDAEVSDRFVTREVNTERKKPQSKKRAANNNNKAIIEDDDLIPTCPSKENRKQQIHREVFTDGRERNTSGSQTVKDTADQKLGDDATIPTSNNKHAKINSKLCQNRSTANCSCIANFDLTAICCEEPQPSSSEQKMNDSCACPPDFTKFVRDFRKNITHCHEYAQKVRNEAEMRKDGRGKDADDFTELPLSFLLGKSEQPPPSTSSSIKAKKTKVARSASMDTIGSARFEDDDDSKGKKLLVDAEERGSRGISLGSSGKSVGSRRVSIAVDEVIDNRKTSIGVEKRSSIESQISEVQSILKKGSEAERRKDSTSVKSVPIGDEDEVVKEKRRSTLDSEQGSVGKKRRSTDSADIKKEVEDKRRTSIDSESIKKEIIDKRFSTEEEAEEGVEEIRKKRSSVDSQDNKKDKKRSSIDSQTINVLLTTVETPEGGVGRKKRYTVESQGEKTIESSRQSISPKDAKDSLMVLIEKTKKPRENQDDDKDDSSDETDMQDFRRNRRAISFAAPQKNGKPLLPKKDSEISEAPENVDEKPDDVPTRNDVQTPKPDESPSPKDDKIKTESKPSDDDDSTTEVHRQYTDQELFDKLLESYEREEDIAERLSKDDEFFEAQLSTVRSKESVEKIIADTKQDKPKTGGLLGKLFRHHKSSVTEIVPLRHTADESEDQIDVIATADERIAEHRFEEIEQDIRTMEAKDEPKVQFSDTSITPKDRDLMFSDDEGIAKNLKTERRHDGTTTTTAIEPNEIGKCFRRGFRPDNIVLTGEPCLKISEKEQRNRVGSEEGGVSFIDFSERDTPLEFLLGLGFSVDEASNAIKDEDVKNRLNAAITEARVWINRINTTQGTMLYLVAFKTRPKTMRYFLQLVEAIINQRVIDAVKLDGFLKLLEKIEEGNVNMITILGMDKIDDEQNEENMVKKQLRKLFYDVYKIAEREAAANKKQLSRDAIVLLRILAAKYRAGLQPHLELIAKYIGQDLLTNEVQLEAAMIYLARIDTADVNLRDFEEYCAISCKEKPTKKQKKKHAN